MTVVLSPAVIVVGEAVTTKLAAAGLTWMFDSVPLDWAGVSLSATVRDWVPAVFRVAAKVCVPASAAVKV